MAMPTKVRIGPADVAIRINHECGDHGSSGMVRVMRDAIDIAPDLGPSYLRVTVWHEILHLMIAQLGYQQDSNDADNERFVDGLSNKLVEVIRNNPHLVVWTNNIDLDLVEDSEPKVHPTEDVTGAPI